VNCAMVRGRLTELALGSLSSKETDQVDRHLQWCAACRKEAGDLAASAAVLAFAAAPSAPDPALEERVVEKIRAAADRRAPASVRRGRMAVAAVVAAMVAVSGLGWGAVMAGKAARSERAARAATLAQQQAIDRFSALLRSAPFNDPRGEVSIGTLAPVGVAAQGGGSAMTVVSPSVIDMAVVMVSGLPARPRSLPLSVRLLGTGLPQLAVGRIGVLDAGGGATISRQFVDGLAGYVRVEVRDAAGRTILKGRLATQTPLASPTP
jgi:predicted anti-sigma-YlaC factor YlaD